ncbi:MAG: peptidase M28 family protein, partial [Bryobacteraceae bacterium]
MEMLSRVLLGLFCVTSCLTVTAKEINISKKYKDPANKLIDAALADEAGYEKLTYLCDRIGNRLSGSESLPKAI